jgi:Ca-activated chloride channel homolog
MSWRAEELLWLLTAVPVVAGLFVLGWWMRKRATRRFGDEPIVRAMIAGRSGVWRATRGVLYVIAFALAIVALAGPQYGSRTRMLRKRGVDVVIALDFSKSMLARDVRPTRIDRAKAEITRLLDDLGGDRVGVVAFAGETMEFPLTTDYAAVGLFLRDLGPYDMPVGGTAIGRALVCAKHLLERGDPVGAGRDGTQEERSQSRSRLVILFTDGEDHEGDPLSAARELGEAGIKVFTIGIGSRTGEPIPTFAPDGTWTGYMRDEGGQVVTTALTASNEAQLREIAQATGGRYWRAGRGAVGVEQIRREMRRMKQEERRTRRVTVNEDRYALVLLPAFLLLVLEGLMPDAWIGRRKRGKKEART